MKLVLISLLSLTLYSCTPKESGKTAVISDEATRIDSINTHRRKWNDSIAIRNQQNTLKDLSGKHQLKFSSDGISAFSGTATFIKTDRDFYEVSGSAKSKNNSLKITGTVKKVTEKHLNFEGQITQNINGHQFVRSKKTTFFDEGKGNFWRLQNKVNGDGFVDYIDIYY